jgi:DNA primase
MGKIGLVSAKYIIHAKITVEGVVERPDIVGAIFGQTEGLLGSDLELRELQRNGKIGRIEINSETKGSKTSGEIIIPSNLDKTETALIAAILETIEKIGPCNAKVISQNIEDVRTSKRDHIMERAKELLKDLTYNVLPDSLELTEEVANSVRLSEIVDYGSEKLASGPGVKDSEEIIIVEGRADVLNLLKNGIKNCIAINGTSVPTIIKELTKTKIVTIFVDGDRGGDLIIKELVSTSEIDFISKAPDGKEVEELTKKEINIALRNKLPTDKFKVENGRKSKSYIKPSPKKVGTKVTKSSLRKPINSGSRPAPSRSSIRIPKKEAETYKKMLDELVGTRGAYILDKELNILGKVPTPELLTTVKSLSDVHAVIMDGEADIDLVRTAERSRVKYLVAMGSKVNARYSKLNIITKDNLS